MKVLRFAYITFNIKISGEYKKQIIIFFYTETYPEEQFKEDKILNTIHPTTNSTNPTSTSMDTPPIRYLTQYTNTLSQITPSGPQSSSKKPRKPSWTLCSP